MQIKLAGALILTLAWSLTERVEAQSYDPQRVVSPRTTKPTKVQSTRRKAEDPEESFDEFESEYEEPKRKAGSKVFDPLYYWNKSWFHFNDKLYFWFFKPVAKGWGFVVPEPARIAVDRAFNNLGAPMRMTANALQGRFDGAGRELGRFTVNSVAGIGGLFDPAQEWFKWKATDEDLGQAFGSWGIGDGFPLVLPVLGQMNVRDGIGQIGNPFLNPIYYFTDFPVYTGVMAGGRIDNLSLNIDVYDKAKKDAIDPYTHFRDIYKQNRDKKIRK